MDIVTTVTLAWLYFKQKVTEPTTEREPFVPPVTPIPLEENNMGIEREPFVPVVPPGNGFTLDAEEEEPTIREPFVPVVPPTPVCPPVEVRMDLTTADTINYDSRIKPCGCPPGYRKVEVRRGHTTATRCYNGD